MCPKKQFYHHKNVWTVSIVKFEFLGYNAIKNLMDFFKVKGVLAHSKQNMNWNEITCPGPCFLLPNGQTIS